MTAVETYVREPFGWRSLESGDLLSDAHLQPWSRLRHVTLYTGGFEAGPVTHGEELTPEHVGPWALQAVEQGQEVLSPGTGSQWKISNFPGEVRPSWYPESTTYVYNNDLDNHGGIVPAGGLEIDGDLIPEGVVVVQFRDLSGHQINIEGSLGDTIGTWPGVMFRGCRWRQASENVGMIRDNNAGEIERVPNGPSPTGGTIYIHYCDMGGLSQATEDYCEIPIKIVNSSYQIKRNYISNVTTATQCVSFYGGPANQIENYITGLTEFGTVGPHLNGISINGGDTHLRAERNHIVIPTPDENGNPVNQTDCIAFFQDGAAFPGTGTNDDESSGFRLIDNYMGGTGYCVYAGGGAFGPVANMQWIGNKWTTRYYQNGGANGPVAGGSASTNGPQWGADGNVWEDNTWADDYGTGTGLTGRQYPAGDGPRTGTAVAGG